MRIILVLFLFAAANAFGQEADIRLNLSKGSTYYHTFTGKVTINEKLDGEDFNIETSTGAKVAYKIRDIKETLYDTEIRYKTFKMAFNTNGRTFEFDSEAKDKGDIFSRIFKQIINKPFFAKMSNLGKMVEVENVDRMWGNVVEHLSELSAAEKIQYKDMLIKACGEKAFLGNFDMITAMYPSKKVSKGEKWKVTTHLELGMSSIMEATYELKEITDEDYYIIHSESTIKTADKDAYLQINGMDARYDLSGTVQTVMKVSKSTGWVIDGTWNQHMSGTVYIKANDKLPEGMVIPMSLNTTMTVEGN